MLSVQEIQDMNVTMLGLGAPIIKDGQGYNRPDYICMECIGMLLSPLTFEEAYLAISTLLKYKNTQLTSYAEDIENTYRAYTDEFNKRYPPDTPWKGEYALDYAKNGGNHPKEDFRKKNLIFYGVEDDCAVLAFQEFVSDFNLRAYGGCWTRLNEKTVMKVPLDNIENFLEDVSNKGKYGYQASQSLIDTIAEFRIEKPKEVLDPNKPFAVFSFTGMQNNYGHDVYELTVNDYKFNQKLWELKGEALKYVDTKSNSNKVFISTDKDMLPHLLYFLKENKVDISSIRDTPIVDQNKSDNKLIDVSKLDLPFKPYDFQIEDAETIVGKKKALLGHDMGCISGKSKVNIKTNAHYCQVKVFRSITIEELFEIFKKDKSIQIETYIDNSFKFMPIKAVIDKGIQETIRITTNDSFLECTKDHEIYTNNGWVEAQNLSVGDRVVEKSGMKEIISIGLSGKQHVYDIAIDDIVIHNFTCNGIVVHNCGKTFISSLVGMSIPEKKLVICPETLRLNWKRELEQTHKGADIKVIYSKDKNPEFGDDWTIMGFKTAVKFADLIKNQNFNCMFVDEAHKCKAVNNYGKPSSKQANVVIDLSRNMTYTYLLTGTPMPTRNKDLYNELVMLGEINPDAPYAFHRFGVKYCDGHNTKFGWDFNGSSNNNELHEVLCKYMTRRLKSEVLPNLTKQRIPIHIETPLSRDYLNVEKRLHNMEQGDTYMGLAMKGRRLLSQCKVDSAIEFADNIIESNESVVLVAEFDETLDEMMAYYGEDACCIRGGMSDVAKQKAIDEFQSGEKKVCCINLIAAGVGITLTKASNMVICDFDWTPANMTQVEDRICRTGQNEHCNIFYICHENAMLDNIFMDMITNKSANIDRIVDAAENTVDLISMNENDFAADEYLSKLKERIKQDNKAHKKLKKQKKVEELN